MAKWTVIDLDKDIKTGTVLGVTFAMKVPGGVIIRTAGDAGISMVFVPMKETMIAQGVSSIDQWIADNKIINT